MLKLGKRVTKIIPAFKVVWTQTSGTLSHWFMPYKVEGGKPSFQCGTKRIQGKAFKPKSQSQSQEFLSTYSFYISNPIKILNYILILLVLESYLTFFLAITLYFTNF